MGVFIMKLMIASDIFQLIANKQDSDFSRKLWVFVGISFAVVIAFRIAPDSEHLVRWSEKIIPAIHLAWAYIAVPIILLVIKLRRKF